MLICEPIILSTTVYISIAYSLVFFYFQAYPIIFEGMSMSVSVLGRKLTPLVKESLGLMSSHHHSHISQVSCVHYDQLT